MSAEDSFSKIASKAVVKKSLEVEVLFYEKIGSMYYSYTRSNNPRSMGTHTTAIIGGYDFICSCMGFRHAICKHIVRLLREIGVREGPGEMEQIIEAWLNADETFYKFVAKRRAYG